LPRIKGQNLDEGGTGRYYEPHPVDLAVLEMLPAEGTMFGWHVIAIPASGLLRRLNETVPKEGQLKMSELTGRLVAMKAANLVVIATLMGEISRKSGTQHGWQRTKKGEALYAEYTGKELVSTEVPPTSGGTEGGGE
jgi:hypothetical protein